MATTRDHVAAYDYESRRRVTSLVLGADEAGRDPHRRLNRTGFGSLILAVLVLAGFGIAGLLGGGRGPALPDSGAVLVKGTGDRYVVVDGVVHPALNLSSALLVGGGTLTEVRASTLDGKPRGLPVGIPQAPDGLSRRLATGPWTVCVLPSDSRVVPPQIEVLIGLPTPTAAVLTGNAAVIAVDGGASWLVTLGRRYRLTGNTATVLNPQGARSVPVPGRVLDTLPEGPEIAIPAVASGGPPSVALPVRANVGDVIQTQVGGQPPTYYLVRPDGLTRITPLTARLLLAAHSALVTADPAAGNAPPSRYPSPDQPGWPKEVPSPLDPARGQPLCLSSTPGAPPGDAPWRVTASLPPALPSLDGIRPVATNAGGSPGTATSVAITPGTAALVLATTTAGADGGYNLITESGQRFPITSADAVARLQFAPASASRLPLPFVALLPSGPALDPQAAAREYTGTIASAPPP
jgi:type VII secretion protein EccB